MTANEETKVAQMVDGYETKIAELEAELANSVPWEVLSEWCDKTNCEWFNTECKSDTPDNCPLMKGVQS